MFKSVISAKENKWHITDRAATQDIANLLTKIHPKEIIFQHTSNTKSGIWEAEHLQKQQIYTIFTN